MINLINIQWKDYFKGVEEFILDFKVSIQQFANFLEEINNKIKTFTIENKYITDGGKSLNSVNEMITIVSLMIQTLRGVGTNTYKEI